MRFTVFSMLLLVGATLSVNPLTDWLVDGQFAQASLKKSDVAAPDDRVGKELTRVPPKAELRMYCTKAKRDAAYATLFAAGR